MPTTADRLPRHVAIIMDGNGRWAARHGWPRLRGHEEGAESVIAILRACRRRGIRYLTLYAFSSENWRRPHLEIAGLMNLLRRFLRDREAELHENRIRLRVIGRLADLPRDVQRKLQRVADDTARYDDYHLILALSYGSRTELADAARQIAIEACEGRLRPERISERTIARHLYAPDVPDPDLMIRTSGEIRLSNFLLWQLSYAELYFTPVLWPEFRDEEFQRALDEYARRQRRFGAIS